MFDFLMDPAQLGEFLNTGLRLSIPLAYAALGGLICERAGVFNISLEGQIILGAFGAAVGSYFLGFGSGGLLICVLLSGLSGVLLAVLGITLAVNQIVVGLAINMLAVAMTSFLSRIIFEGGSMNLTLTGFAPFEIPFLVDMPFVGRLLFNQDILFYVLTALIVIVWMVLNKTSLGLAIRATGENPAAADTAGIPVFVLRYGCVVAGSMIAGLGGAYLVLSQVFLFSDQMSAGKGFIALAAIILGRWTPAGALMACLLFGLLDAFQLRMQFQNPHIPFQLYLALPYIVAIAAFVGLIGKVHAPAATGQVYERETR